MIIALSVVAYLVVGYFWSMFFMSKVLDNGMWDTPRRSVTPFEALLFNLTWPIMLFIGVIALLVEVLSRASGFFRKLYRLKD